VNIRGKREGAEAGPADGAGGGTLARRNVLGGLAALPILVSVGSAVPALTAPGRAGSAVRPGSVPAAAGDLVRGTERRYNAPLLTPGTRLVLPAGVKAVPVLDYYQRPRLAPAGSTWPYLFVYGEFGGTDEEPFRDRFYTLALQPMSRNPYTRSATIL
jgi:hypothetical protein